MYIRIDAVFDQQVWTKALRRASRPGLTRLVAAGSLVAVLGFLVSATDDFNSGLALIVFGFMFGGVLPLLAVSRVGSRVPATSRQPTTYEFTDETIRSTNSLVRMEASWSVYTGAMLGRGYVALRQGTRMYSIIPTASLNPAQLAELEAFLRNKFPERVRGTASNPPGFEANAAALPPQQNFTVPPGGAAAYTGPAPVDAGYHPGPTPADRTE